MREPSQWPNHRAWLMEKLDKLNDVFAPGARRLGFGPDASEPEKISVGFYEAWRNVPVAEVSEMDSFNQAGSEYEEHLRNERYHIRRLRAQRGEAIWRRFNGGPATLGLTPRAPCGSASLA